MSRLGLRPPEVVRTDAMHNRTSFSIDTSMSSFMLTPYSPARPPPPYQAIDPEANSRRVDPSAQSSALSGIYGGIAPLARSATSLAPPPDDFNAPPSYADATTTEV